MSDSEDEKPIFIKKRPPGTLMDENIDPINSFKKIKSLIPMLCSLSSPFISLNEIYAMNYDIRSRIYWSWDKKISSEFFIKNKRVYNSEDSNKLVIEFNFIPKESNNNNLLNEITKEFKCGIFELEGKSKINNKIVNLLCINTPFPLILESILKNSYKIDSEVIEVEIDNGQCNFHISIDIKSANDIIINLTNIILVLETDYIIKTLGYDYENEKQNKLSN